MSGSLACPHCGAPYEREPERTGLRLCRKCGGVVNANPAALVLRRFGGEIEAAASAWRRMLGNGCSDADFVKLASAPVEVEREPFSELRTAALLALVETIDATGGVVYDGRNHGPIADEDWIDLADAYLKACHALGREPKVTRLDGMDP